MTTRTNQPRPAIQLWAPLQTFSIFNEKFNVSLSKAALEWQGEDIIWLTPGVPEPCRWRTDEPPFIRELALPDQSFNVINCIHINQDRELYPGCSLCLPPGLTKVPDDFFSQFLTSRIKQSLLKEQSHLAIAGPYVNEGTLYPRAMYSLSPKPGVGCSIDEIDMLLSSEPFSESLGIQRDTFPEGAFDYEISDTLNLIFNFENPTLTALFPLDVNLYALNSRKLMAQYLKHNNEAKIRETANKYCEETTSTFYQAWLRPKIHHHYNHDKDNAENIILTELEAVLKLDKNYRTVREVLEDPDLAEVLYEIPYPVVRIKTWVGYFWWELNRRVRMGRNTLKPCGLCGKLISGRMNKKFCSRNDNEDCWKARRARDRQVERKQTRS